MKSFKNIKELIVGFLNGEKEGFAGPNPALSNTRIIGDQIIHFSTPILERNDLFLVLNISQYSLQTSKLQKMILEFLREKNYVTVSGVEINYKGSLVELLKKES